MPSDMLYYSMSWDNTAILLQKNSFIPVWVWKTQSLILGIVTPITDLHIHEQSISYIFLWHQIKTWHDKENTLDDVLETVNSLYPKSRQLCHTKSISRHTQRQQKYIYLPTSVVTCRGAWFFGCFFFSSSLWLESAWDNVLNSNDTTCMDRYIKSIAHKSSHSQNLILHSVCSVPLQFPFALRSILSQGKAISVRVIVLLLELIDNWWCNIADWRRHFLAKEIKLNELTLWIEIQQSTGGLLKNGGFHYWVFLLMRI